MEHPAPDSFDIRAALEGLGGQASLLCELAELYVREAAGMVGDVREALDQNNAEEVSRALHSFRGALGYFHANELDQTLSRMYDTATTGNLDAVREQWTTLAAASAQLTRDLKAFIDAEST